MVVGMLRGEKREERCARVYTTEGWGRTGEREKQQRSAEGRGCTRAEVTFNVSRHAAQGTVSLASSSLLIWRQFPGNLPSKN